MFPKITRQFPISSGPDINPFKCANINFKPFLLLSRNYNFRLELWVTIFFYNNICTYIKGVWKETWPLKKMYVSCTDPSCHKWFHDFLLVRQNSFNTAYPMNYQNKPCWQLRSVHKIHIHIEATTPLSLLFEMFYKNARKLTKLLWNLLSLSCLSTWVPVLFPDGFLT